MRFFSSRWQSVLYALNGIRLLVRTQVNAQIHLVATCAVVVAGFYFSVSASEWCALVLAMGLVWAAEALNTGIEAVVDLVSPEKHELAGKAKDVAAAGVLLASVAALVVGLVVFVPYVI